MFQESLNHIQYTHIDILCRQWHDVVLCDEQILQKMFTIGL